MSKIDDDTYAFTYKGTFDGACTENGKQDKLPSPVRGATIFVRSGDKWQAAWHGEQMVMEAAKDEKADTAKPADTKKEDAAKPADTKKEEAAKPADTAKKTDKVVPIGATKTAPANATGAQASTEAAKPDANTDALLKAETAGWNAWRDKDTKALDSFAAKTLAFVEPDGSYTGSRASVLEMWGRTSGCEGVKTVNLTNGFAWALSPTVELLTYDSTIDGTCQGQKNGPMHGMTVYIKEGDAWKATFGFVQPARKM
jgi:hypothetical protein